MDQVVSVEEILNLISDLNVFQLDIMHKPGTFSEKKYLMLDSSLARNELGWDNSSNLHEDLTSIIHGYELMLSSPSHVIDYCRDEIRQRLTV